MKKLTRERIEQYASDPRICNVTDEIREMARLALSAMDSQSEGQAEGAIGVFRVGSKSGQVPPVVLTEAVKNLPEGVYWLYATHQPTPGQRREWMAQGAEKASSHLADLAKSLSPASAELVKSAARSCFHLAAKVRAGEVE